MFRKKSAPEPVVEAELEPLPEQQVRLTAYWDDEKAQWKYRIEKVINSNSNPFQYMAPEPGKWTWYSFAQSDDKEWADRQAEHYKVEIIYEEAK